MKRTATLRRAVDVETAPNTTMNCLGPTFFRVPTEARVAAAPPPRPGSHDTLAPAIVPRSALRASSGDRARRGSTRWYGIEPGRARNPRSRLGMPKSPEKSGKRTASGSTRLGPRRTAIPRPAASAWTHTARTNRRTRFRPRDSEASTAAKTNTRNTGVQGRKWSARRTGSARRNRSGTKATTANAVPSNAPRAASATAFAPWPTRRRRCPGRVARAVSSVGAPRNTAGMKSKTAWLPAVARRKQDRRRPIVSGSGGLDHEQVAASQFERDLGGQPATPSVPHEEVLPRTAVVSAFKTFRR